MPGKRKPKVVLDSVVLVSAFLTEGLASEILAWCSEKVQLYTAEEILQEVRSVLLEKRHIRKKYLYHDTQVERFIELIREQSNLVRSLPDIQAIERDPKDDIIIACALAAQANYIVSRDLDLLELGVYRGIQIISPEDFAHHLRDEAQ